MSNDLKSQVYNAIIAVLPSKNIVLSDDMTLVGYDSLLDSMKMIELCLVLEELAADIGFKFDWNTASIQSRGIFSTVGTLTNAFIAQYTATQES
jgi:acyl carrier protein